MYSINFNFNKEVIYNKVLNTHIFKLFKEHFLFIYIFRRGEGGRGLKSIFLFTFEGTLEEGGLPHALDIFRHYSSLLKLPIFDVPVL